MATTAKGNTSIRWWREISWKFKKDPLGYAAIFAPSAVLLSIAFSKWIAPFSWNFSQECSYKLITLFSLVLGVGISTWTNKTERGGHRHHVCLEAAIFSLLIFAVILLFLMRDEHLYLAYPVAFFFFSFVVLLALMWDKHRYLVAVLLLVIGMAGTAALYGLEHACSWGCAFEWDAFYFSLPLAVWLTREKCVNESLGRVRAAIAILALIGMVIASASASYWFWLSGDAEPNSQSVQHIALGLAAVLTLVFVVWRERIASGKATFERFTTGVQMLGDQNISTRLAGVGIILEVCENRVYRDQGLRVLRAFANNNTSASDDVRAAREAIKRLR